MKLDLVVVGHLIVEYIKFGSKTIGPVLGSPVAYTSISGQRLGMKTGVVSRIGSDMPNELLTPLLDLKIDLSGLGRKGDSTRTTILSYDSQGGKTAFYQKTAPPIEITDFPKKYFSAQAMLIAPMDYEIPSALVAQIKTKFSGYFIADLGGFGGAVSTSRSDSPRERLAFLKKLLPHLDIVKASDEDCAQIFGPTVSTEKAGKWLVKDGPKVVIVTLGSDGGLIFEKNVDAIRRFPAIPSQVKDTTGAGDVFGAGFIVEYLRSEDVEKSCLMGAAVASIVIQRTGGAEISRMPVMEEVLALTEHNQGNIVEMR